MVLNLNHCRLYILEQLVENRSMFSDFLSLLFVLICKRDVDALPELRSCCCGNVLLAKVWAE